MITLTINGKRREVDVPPDMTLLWVLRDALSLTGTRFGCRIAQCGACTVHLAGKPVRSCLLSVGAIGARVITTIESNFFRKYRQRLWLRVLLSFALQLVDLHFNEL